MFCFSSYKFRPLEVDISKTSIILFPGQGSQYVGMGKNLIKFPGVKAMFDAASEILRTDLARTCIEGPFDKLSKTIHCQPAILVSSLAALYVLKEENSDVVENCVATAGYSVGELTSLIFSGALSFDQGVQLCRVRAEAMQKCCEKHDSGMLTVFLKHNSELKNAIKAAKLYCQETYKMDAPVLQIANYLTSDCKVIAGHSKAIDYFVTHADSFNIPNTKKVPVNGAFHTHLMQMAANSLDNCLEKMSEYINDPQIQVISNLTAEPYLGKTSIRRTLTQQIVKPVKWEQTLHALFARPPGEEFPAIFEVGPGRNLGAMLRLVNRPAFKKYTHISS